MYEMLVYLCLNHIERLRYPIRFMISFLLGGCSDGLGSQFQLSDEKVWQCIRMGIFDYQRVYKVLNFLTTLIEEFSSGEVDEQTRTTFKSLLSADDNLVCSILQTVMLLYTSDKLAVESMKCAQLWLSVIIGNRGVTEHMPLLLLIYNSMPRSESLYMTGLECLVNLFEDGGAGLGSGHGTVVLLDFHVGHLVKLLEPTFQNLVAKHRESALLGKRWDDFEQKEPLGKIILILQSLTNIEMHHLIDRAGRTILDTNSQSTSMTTCQLLSLLPLTLSLTGGYPDQETVSEMGLQIWLNLIDTLPIPPTENSPNRIGVLTQLQEQFLLAAFIKCRHSNYLDAIFAPRDTENLLTWYSFRVQMGDAFLASYGPERFRGWFLQLQQQMVAQFTHFDEGGFGRYWQDDEVILYIFDSISEQVIAEAERGYPESQELATIVFYSLCKLAKCALLEFWSSDTCQGTPQLSDWTLIATALSVCNQYLPLFSRLYAVTDETWDPSHVNTLIDFVFTCLSQLSRLVVSWNGPFSLLNTAVKAGKSVIANMANVIMRVTDRLLPLLEVGLGQCQDNGPVAPDAAGIAHCIGSLLALSPGSTKEAADRIVSAQLGRLQEQLTAVVTDRGSSSTALKSQINADKSLTGTHKSKNAPTYLLQCTQGNPDNRLNFTIFAVHTHVQLSFFTELFSGIRSVLARDQSDVKPQSEDTNGILLIVGKALLRVVICLQQLAEQTLPELLLMDELNELLRVGFRTLLPASSATFSTLADILTHLKILLLRAISSAHTSRIRGCLTAVRLIVETSTSDALLYIAGYNTSRVLFENVVTRVDGVLQQLAKDALPLDNFRACRRLQHPLPPLLLILKAQSVTDELEAFATFFTLYLEWWVSKVKKNNVITNDLLARYNPMLHWKLYLSVGLTGICLPEWRTVERCLGLVRRVLIADQARNPTDSLITEEALLQIHSSVLIRITRGFSVNRLLNQLAQTYLQLTSYSAVPPSRQLAQVSSLLNCSETVAECDIQWAQNHPDFVFAIQRAVQSASVVERSRFLQTVLQPAASIEVLKTAIKTFLVSCREAR